MIYVNTSLRVKAEAQALLPTITCTSSNVLPMLLQAFAQVPDLHVWFGPDTYMGKNLSNMLAALSRMDARAIAALHPAHTPQTLAAAHDALPLLRAGRVHRAPHVRRRGRRQVQRDYQDALITAHLEVPGEMFALAFAAQQQGRGVVGSTSNILDFIGKQVDEAVAARKPGKLRFILGTEAGDDHAGRAQRAAEARGAAAAGGPEIDVEIVFPVASEAIATTSDVHLPIVPGVAGGEGAPRPVAARRART